MRSVGPLQPQLMSCAWRHPEDLEANEGSVDLRSCLE